MKMITAGKVQKKTKMIFLIQLRRSTTDYFSAVAPVLKLPAQSLKTNIWDGIELFFMATAILCLILGTDLESSVSPTIPKQPCLHFFTH